MGHKEAAGAKRCAASMAGHPISVEYITANEDGTPYVAVLAVHVAGRRVPAHWFAADAITDWEHEAEMIERTSECEWGIPTEDSMQTMRVTPRQQVTA